MLRRSLRSSSAVVVGLSLLASLAVLLPAAPSVQAAQPKPNQTGLVPETARTTVPRITTGEITDLAYIGDRVFIAGTFTSIRNNTATNTTSVAQRYLASYNMTTGLIDTGFRPTFDSTVEEVEASPDGTKLFIVGRFNTVNGVTKRKIASINPTTGATIAGFTANASSAATSVEATNTTVYVGGQFQTVNGTARAGLVAVSATTGAVVTAFNNNLSGGIGTNGMLTVQAMVLSHDDSKLLVVHTGRQIAGQDRYGAGLISTTTNQLLPWRTRLWDDNLQFVGGVQRAYAADIAPNDQYFVVTSGSGGDRPPISDTAVAFPLNGNDNVQPLWISRLFDSVYSVAISEVAVYLGGHFNYMESPTATQPWPGLDNVGYGQGQGLAGYGLGDEIVTREHIGAVDPATGTALEWSPTSNSFEGNKAMLLTPRGLFAGGDATTQGGANVGRVAFYDLNSVPAPGPNETTIINPIEGRVKTSDVEFVVDGTATAASGVNRVQVEVRDRDSLQYLQDDLVTWGAANTINANLGAGTTNRTWSLPLTISGNHKFQLLARTYGNNGSNDATKAVKKFETFGLADQTPTTSITGPPGSIIPTTTFILTGTAQDDFGVNSITFSFRDAQNRYLQDDGTTGPTYNSFRGFPDVSGATAATWSYEVTVPYESTWTMQATAVDTTGQSDLRSATKVAIVSATALAPTVTIATPAVMIPPTANLPMTIPPGGPLTFTGTATDDQDLDYVEVSLRNSATRESLSNGGDWGVNSIAGWYRISPATSLNGTTYNWTFTTPAPMVPGTYTFAVRAYDDLGLSTSNANRGALTINVQVPGDAYPEGKLNVTGTVSGLQSLHLDLAGTATDDLGVSAVRLTFQDRNTTRYVQPNGTMAAAFAFIDATTVVPPGGTSTTWTLSIDLPTQGDYNVTVYAYDTAGQQDPTTSAAADLATARYPIYPGDTPPTFVAGLLSPTEGTIFTDSKIFVSGRMEDDQQMASVQVAIVNSLGQYLNSAGAFSPGWLGTATSPSNSWRTAYLNSPGTPGSNFAYTTPALPAGTYSVFVRGVDQHGLITLVPAEIHVSVTAPANNLPPVSLFTYSCAANVCSFDGRSSTDETPATLTYSWAFGQSSATGTGPLPIRTYTAAGTFIVTLTVRDEFGVTGVSTQTLPPITEPATNVAPTPVFNPQSCVALVCNFSAVGSTDANIGDTLTYLWNFGDGTPTSTASAVTHTFAASGPYTVTLTVADGWLRAATPLTRSFTVTGVGGNVPPTAVISPPSCNALACSFSGSTSSDPEGPISSYAWAFSDGGTATGATPSHTFPSAGTYQATLTVTDSGNLQASAQVSVTVSTVAATATFRAQATAQGSAATASVAIPAAVQAGDQLVLFITANVATTASTPAGWTLLGTQSDGSPDMRTWVFTRTAVAGGGTVSSALGATAKTTRNLVAYSGAGVPTVIASSVIGATSASLTAPAVAAPAGSRVVRQWANKTSAATGWTLPAGITSRGAAIGTGTGRIVAIAGDSATGGAATATSDTSGAKGIAFTVMVPPAP